MEDDFDAGVVCVGVLCMWFLHLVVCMLPYFILEIIYSLRIFRLWFSIHFSGITLVSFGKILMLPFVASPSDLLLD